MFRTIFAIGFFTLVSTAASASGPPPSYALHCKGGPAMDMGLSSTGFGFVLTFPMVHSETNDIQSLAAGQCTWADRPLNADEPSVLSFSHGNRARFRLSSVSGSDPTGGFVASTDLYADREHIKDANALVGWIRDGVPFTVDAYSRDGVLVITAVRR